MRRDLERAIVSRVVGKRCDRRDLVDRNGSPTVDAK